MALITLGTVTTSALSGVLWQPAGVSAADLATVRTSILQDNDGIPNQPQPGALENGRVVVPGGRGTLTLLPGDFIAFDGNGFPHLIPGTYVPSSGFSTAATLNGTAVVTSMASNAFSMGWQPGMFVAGSGISSGTQILTMTAGGSSMTLSQVASVSSAGVTLTVGGGWTHT